MMPLARLAPDRFAGLFFFDFVYPGLRSRMGAPVEVLAGCQRSGRINSKVRRPT
jgi:hypothetical protein